MTQNLDRFELRVWLKNQKEMLGVYRIDRRTGVIIWDGDGETKIDDCVIMQCTGLKDKKGKLIYEGDLAKVYDETIEAERLLSVVWDNEKCGFDIYQYESNDPIFCYMKEFMGSYEVDHELQSLEILGNIYENPELLKNFRKEDDSR